MPKQNDEFLKRLLATFRIEADEHLQAMSAGLAELERQPVAERRAQIVESLFREAHSLKGAARAVNLREVEQICQPLESVFSALKGGQLSVSQPLVDFLYQAIDAVGGMLAPDAGATASRQTLLDPLLRRFDEVLQGRDAQAETVRQEAPGRFPDVPVAPSAATAAETVRVSTQKLDAVMRQVEELLSPRLAAAQRARELRETAASFVAWKKQRARMRPVLRLIERAVEGGARNGDAAAVQPKFPVAHELPKLLEHLEAEHLFMKTLEERLLRLSKFAAHDWRTLAGMNDSLLHDVKEMQLLPFSALLEIVPRFIRELARDQGKQVALVTEGSEIEMDRHILEEMKAPLIHLLRNCIDHGIELPAVRQGSGKPAQGTITIAVAQKDSGKIEIRVADDGAGVDTDKVKAAAGRMGLAAAGVEQSLGDQEALGLVFQSGLSTSQIITDVSGRGLGLAIVAEKIERLGGTVALESQRGMGTAFRIALPLMLATFRGVLVRVGEHVFIIPVLSVERVTRVAPQDIRTVENRATIALDGQAVALAGLGEVLELPLRKRPQEADGAAPEKVAVVVLGAGQRRVAFRVDEILGEQEVLVKPLGRQLAHVRNVAGASVLGTGRVVVVLNTSDLLKSAVGQTAAPPVEAATQAEEAGQKQSILVAEDSITSRTLLKNILESAGYNVTTAVDGADAYTILKTGAFDLVVSDVEMPRMDGFDLTAKVRADKQLGALPVVLVTALESREYRERGIDAGANAYIVKSSFDQSNLLEVIRRLL